MNKNKMEKEEFDPYKVVRVPLATEKSLRLMERENKLIFIVDKKAKKAEIKKAIEAIFNTHVQTVNTFVAMDGKKRAYVTFAPDKPAIDIATQVGLM